MAKAPAHWTTRLGSLAGHPAAFLIVIAYGGLWFIFSRSTFDWVAVATLAIWCMTLFIQRSDRRDTLAVHVKLDELLKVTRGARTELAQIDEEELRTSKRFATVKNAMPLHKGTKTLLRDSCG